MRAQVGQVISNKYRLLRLIGDGGMGSVYEARHEVLGTSVALKFLHPELNSRSGLVQRFVQEARVSAQIQSAHVVRVTDVDHTPAGAFIVMEYLEGRTLQALYEDLYRAGQQLSYADAIEYAMQVLDGVEAAHKAGVVHRDLKPDNVMITQGPKGRPLLKLLDFGIAKLKVSAEYGRGLTRPGVIMGTPEYMAPEQAFSADAVDTRADIFSLGVMIFEMLAGRRPVGGDEPQQIADAYLAGHVARLTDLAPHVPPALAVAVHRAMEPLVKHRWATVGELRDAIEPHAAAVLASSASPTNPSLLRSAPGVSRSPAMPSPGPVTPPATHGGSEVQKVFASSAASADVGRVPQTLSPGVREDLLPAGRAGMPEHAGGAAPVPPTKSAVPYIPEGRVVDPAATAFAAPYTPLPAGVELSPRPGGTSVGEPALLGHRAEAFAPVPPQPTPYDPFGRRAGGGASMPTPRSRSRTSPLRSLPVILLLAAGMAGAVMGGVYLVYDRAKADDHDDMPPVEPPPNASVASDPPLEPSAPSAFPRMPMAPVKPPPVPPQPPHKPGQPPPKGSASPPPPSATVGPMFPLPLPPIVIPSSLPFELPGFNVGPPPRMQPVGPEQPRPPTRPMPPGQPNGPY